MTLPSRTHSLLFLAGLAALGLAPRFPSPPLSDAFSLIGLLVCVAAMWLAHRASDEVARQIALASFAAGFAAMAGWSLWYEDLVPPYPAWMIGFGIFMLAYAAQWVRSQW